MDDPACSRAEAGRRPAKARRVSHLRRGRSVDDRLPDVVHGQRPDRRGTARRRGARRGAVGGHGARHGDRLVAADAWPRRRRQPPGDARRLPPGDRRGAGGRRRHRGAPVLALRRDGARLRHRLRRQPHRSLQCRGALSRGATRYGHRLGRVGGDDRRRRRAVAARTGQPRCDASRSGRADRPLPRRRRDDALLGSGDVGDAGRRQRRATAAVGRGGVPGLGARRCSPTATSGSG